jgi:hypothetical protein
MGKLRTKDGPTQKGMPWFDGFFCLDRSMHTTRIAKNRRENKKQAEQGKTKKELIKPIIKGTCPLFSRNCRCLVGFCLFWFYLSGIISPRQPLSF